MSPLVATKVNVLVKSPLLLTCPYCVACSIHVVSLILILEAPGTPPHASFVKGLEIAAPP